MESHVAVNKAGACQGRSVHLNHVSLVNTLKNEK
jgi:hypothetical protein